MDLQQVRYLNFVLLLVLFTGFIGGHPTPKESLKSLKLPNKWSVVKCFQLEGRCQPSCKKDEVEIYGVGGCPNTCCVKRKRESMCETFCGGQCETDCSRQAGTELISTRLCMDKKHTQCCVRQNEKPQCNNDETKGLNKSSIYKRGTRRRCGVYGGLPVELEGGWYSPIIRINNHFWVPQYQTTYYCRPGYAQNGVIAVAQCRVDTGYYWTTPQITCTRVFKPSIHKRETRDKCIWGGKPQDVEGAWYGRVERIQNAKFWIPMEQYQVTYHCKAGLTQIGTNAVSQCTFDTKYYWSKPQIKCIRICPKPPTIANAVASGAALTAPTIVEGDKVQYSCKAGFAQTSGWLVRTCSNGAWSGKNIVCKRTCPKPPTYANSVATGEPVNASQIVEGDKVTYTCKSGYYPKLERVLVCTQGSWRGRDLDCQPRKCRAPPTESTFSISPIKTVYNSGERIIQSCRSGYARTGGDALKTCELGKWKPENESILCERSCPTPPNPSGAALVQTSDGSPAVYTEGMSVKYQCQVGYGKVGGDATRTCTAGRWSGDDILCQLICSAPPAIPNTSSSHGQYMFFYREGEAILYLCQPGFAQTDGDTIRTCRSGTWTGTDIKCGKICQPPPRLENGRLLGNLTAVFTSGHKANYTCVPGYTSNGPISVLCGEDGKWTNLDAKTCKRTCPKPPTYANSVATGEPVNASQIVEGDRMTYTCKSGYHPKLKRVLVCTQGSWRGRDLDCQPKKCRAPPTESTFSISPIKTVYNSGERIIQSCRSGYARTGGDALKTCELGKWKPENESILCERTCPTPPNPSGAALVQTSDASPSVYTEGMSVKYQCQVGYGKVGGDATRTCTAGRWSGDDILCQLICSAPPAIPNTSSSHGQFMYFYKEGEAIVYLCQPGFAQTDGDTIRTCRSGKWTGTDIKCGKICQPPPRLENGRLLGNLTAVYTSGDKANYTCVPGYTSNGPISVLCGEDGKWTNLDAKTCKRTCPTPPIYPHATLTLPHASQTHLEGAIAVYSCSLGYMNSGTVPVVVKTCTRGKWSGGTLNCKQDTCPTPPKIPNAVAGQTSTSHGSTVQYTCLPGHTNLGNTTTMTCVYGEWKMTGTMTCAKACPDPPKMIGAHITSAARKFYLEGHNVTYQCDRGHQSTTFPETAHTKICTNSVWKGTDFACKRVCQFPPDVKNAVVTPPPPPFFEGTVVQYTCIPGLVAVNRTALKTCVGGNWTGDDIDCQKVCAQLPYVENTDVIMNHVPGGRLIEGARVIHRCQTGYTQVGGNSLRVCQDGSWTGRDIHCEKSCQAPPTIRNTELTDTPSTYRHGTEVRYQCVNGTLKVGGSETKQCASGNWPASDDLHCEKPCGRPPHLPLSRRVLLKVGPYVPEHYVQGNKVKYECRPGYENVNTGDVKTCEDGRWVGEDVNCQKLTTTTPVTTVTMTEKPVPTTETKEPFAAGTKPTPTPKIIDPVEPGSGDAEKDTLGLVEEIL